MEYLFSIYWKNYRIGYVFFYNFKYVYIYDIDGLTQANKLGFDFLIGFPDINDIYINDKMFPVFINRIKNGERLKRDSDCCNKSNIQNLIDSKGKLVTDNISIIYEKEFYNGKRI